MTEWTYKINANPDRNFTLKFKDEVTQDKFIKYYKAECEQGHAWEMINSFIEASEEGPSWERMKK